MRAMEQELTFAHWRPDGIPMFLLDIQNVGFEFSALKYLAKCCTPQLLGSVEA
jgi:hypothetical protein